jgi:pimeloyl-ACP methyl ester carboxylesterase
MKPQRPPLWKLALESRAGLEWASHWLCRRRLAQWPKAPETPVILLPGLATNQWAMAPMRQSLIDLGYQAYHWELGFNTGPTLEGLEALTKHVRALSKQHGQSVGLVGWSLGGSIARAVAARAPEHVRCVIALGSPLNRNLASHLDALFALISQHKSTDHRLFRWLEKPMRSIPMTSVASVDDGLLSWESSTLPNTTSQETLFLRGVSHLGLPANPYVLWLVHDRLRQEPTRWKPYRSRSKWDQLWKAPATTTEAWRNAMMKG